MQRERLCLKILIWAEIMERGSFDLCYTPISVRFRSFDTSFFHIFGPIFVLAPSIHTNNETNVRLPLPQGLR